MNQEIIDADYVSFFEAMNVVERFADHAAICFILWVVMIMAVVFDMWDAVYTARKLHEKVWSHKLRRTFEKIAEYWRVAFIAFLIDSVGVLFPWYSLPYVSMVICAGLTIVEGKSIFEHIKKRRSSAAKVKDVLEIIIEAASKKDASSAIYTIQEYLKETQEKK